MIRDSLLGLVLMFQALLGPEKPALAVHATTSIPVAALVRIE